jgi:hypothetical protein
VPARRAARHARQAGPPDRAPWREPAGTQLLNAPTGRIPVPISLPLAVTAVPYRRPGSRP